MISERLFDELNKQLNYEFFSSHQYLEMSTFFEDQDLPGFANFFRVQGEEERFHAMKFYNYINQRNGRIRIEGFKLEQPEYPSILDAFKEGLKHEQEVTRRIYNLSDIAIEEREHGTISFLKWFIDEQVEEEDSFNAIIKKLERIGNDSSAIYMLDAELGQRVFTPPAGAQ